MQTPHLKKFISDSRGLLAGPPETSFWRIHKRFFQIFEVESKLSLAPTLLAIFCVIFLILLAVIFTSFKKNGKTFHWN